MQLLKLVQSKVQVGVPLPWNVRNSEGSLLLARGHVIQDEQQLETLLDRGAYVDAEEVKALARAAAGGSAIMTPKLPPSLFELWEQAVTRLEALLKTAGQEPGFVDNIHALATDIAALIERDADIGIYTTVRQEKNKHFYYGYTHSVHTALMGTLMARRMGWPEDQILTLIKAALTMNITIVELQGRMAPQDTPVLDKQRAQIRNHPAAGAELLKKAGVADEEWLTAVAQHHERADGTGHPAGMTTPSPMAQALRMADVFMAKITPRIIRPALTTQEAARQMFREDKGGPMSMAIIKEFGIYPPGDFVKLKSGELAVVVRRSANANAPMVASVTDAGGHSIVSTVRRDTSDPTYAIAGTVADKSPLMRMPPERLYGLSLGA
ncbi:MAG TPA: HD domain-containing phosphohydrolase [Burkholderiaceae bacterium]|nr:HD domain-containing phosphohydrolase [Burkholderiaceae bacterium]